MANRGAKLRTAAVAERLGINPGTWRDYVSDGRAPQPDGWYDARSPWWYQATVDEYDRGRPGRGWRRESADTPRPAPRQRRTFKPEFKAEIVQIVQQGDRSAEQVAREHDLAPSVVRAWVKLAEQTSTG